MPVMPPTFRHRSAPTRAETNQAADRRRGSARDRGYSAAWDRASKGHLDHDPLCRYCDLAGETAAADLTDHLYPHKGDRALFWFKPFWVSCCTACHNGFKQRIERQGRLALDDLAIRLGLPTLDQVDLKSTSPRVT